MRHNPLSTSLCKSASMASRVIWLIHISRTRLTCNFRSVTLKQLLVAARPQLIGGRTQDKEHGRYCSQPGACCCSFCAFFLATIVYSTSLASLSIFSFPDSIPVSHYLTCLQQSQLRFLDLCTSLKTSISLTASSNSLGSVISRI